MDVFPTNNDPRTRVLGDSTLSEEPSRISGSDLESDDIRKSKHVVFAPVPPSTRTWKEANTPASPRVGSSKPSMTRSSRQRAGITRDASIPGVQTVIEAYEAGKQFRRNNSARAGDSTIDNEPTSLGHDREEGRRQSVRREESGDSYLQPTVDEPSSSSARSVSPVSRTSPIVVEQRTRSALRRHRSRDRYDFEIPAYNDQYTVVDGGGQRERLPARRSSQRRSQGSTSTPTAAEWQLEQENAELRDIERRRALRFDTERIQNRMKLEQLESELKKDLSGYPSIPSPTYDTATRSRSRGRSRLGDRYGDSLEHKALPESSALAYYGDDEAYYRASRRRRPSLQYVHHGPDSIHRPGLGSGLHRGQVSGYAPAPRINVYNRHDQTNSLYPSYERYSVGPSSTRSSPRTSPDGRRRSRMGDRLNDALEQEIHDMVEERSYGRSRSARRELSRERAEILAAEEEPIKSRMKLEQIEVQREKGSLKAERRQRDSDQKQTNARKRAIEEYERKQLELKAIEAKLRLEVMEEETKKADNAIANDEREDRLLSTNYDSVLPERYAPSKYEVQVSKDETSNSDITLPSRPMPNVRIMPITSSRWNQSIPGSGSNSAILETPHGAAAPPDFVWAHIRKPARSFADLVAVVSSLPSLSDSLKIQVTEFLDDVQSRYEHQKNDGLELAPSAVFCNSRVFRNSTPLFFAACEDLQVHKLPGQNQQAPDMHPSRPLMGIVKPGADAAREKKQVLNLLSGAKDNRCLYVSQTWLLLVGDICLVTTSSRSEDDIVPPKAIASRPTSDRLTASAGKVKLSYCGRSWVVAASDCRSWPSLWASFLDALAERAHGLTLMHGSKLLDSKTWQLLQNEERKSDLELRIVKDEAQSVPRSMKTLQHELDVHTNALDSAGAPMTSHDPEQKAQASSDSQLLLSIFRFAKSHSAGGAVLEIAKELDKILSNDTALAVRDAYRHCDSSSPQDVNAVLTDYRVSRSGLRLPPGCAELVLHLKHLFDFFWPRDADHEMFSKFHHMLKGILDAGKAQPYFEALYDWRAANECLRRALRTAAWITTTFIDDTKHFPDPSADFVKAWLHLHTAVALLSLPSQQFNHSPANWEAAIRHLELFATCLEAADEALVKALRTADIKNHECVQASGTFWLSLSRLMSEEVGSRIILADSYAQYLVNLDSEITSKPTDRKLQERLRMFKEEVEGIRDILDRNFSAIAEARNVEGMGIIDSNQARPPLGDDDPRSKLSRDTLLRLRKRSDRFNELAQVAAVLQSQTEREVGEVKNDQEKAIYLFTIVTVIFLPLSFVSSIFGMNTNDIRNLNLNQWIFWVVAIPVTVFVVVTCLWFTGGIRLGLSWPLTTERRTFTSLPSSYQDAINSDHFELREKRNLEQALNASDARLMRHSTSFGPEPYTIAEGSIGRRRVPVRRRTEQEYY